MVNNFYLNALWHCAHVGQKLLTLPKHMRSQLVIHRPSSKNVNRKDCRSHHWAHTLVTWKWKRPRMLFINKHELIKKTETLVLNVCIKAKKFYCASSQLPLVFSYLNACQVILIIRFSILYCDKFLECQVLSTNRWWLIDMWYLGYHPHSYHYFWWITFSCFVGDHLTIPYRWWIRP
jgi:hypothetical protein